jgi:hypothetical protein
MATKIECDPVILTDSRDLAKLESPGRTGFFSTLPQEIIFALVLAGILAVWVSVSRDANIVWLGISVVKTLYAIAISLAGLFVCLATLYLIWCGLVPLFRRRRGAPRAFLVVCIFVILAIAAVNIFPISIYLGIFQEMGWPNIPAKIISLAFSNSMMFVFFYACLSGLLVESQKAYVVSSVYRDSTEDRALSEFLHWTVLTLLSPMFYYIFSFTLFSDLMYADVSYAGIVGTVFVEILHEGWTEKALFDLSIALVGSTMVRSLFVWILTAWLLRRDLYRQV